MFRYQPPKSSVWGHLLRKMPAARAKPLLDQFLATAVAEYALSGASLAISDPSGEIVARYERLAGVPARDGRFDRLTLEQSNRCLDEFMKDEAANADVARRFVIGQAFAIAKWRLHGELVPTQSLLTMQYGQLPCLSTFFQFETVEQFHAVQRVLADLGLCKLQEKHLKAMKRAKATDA